MGYFIFYALGAAVVAASAFKLWLSMPNKDLFSPLLCIISILGSWLSVVIFVFMYFRDVVIPRLVRRFKDFTRNR